MAEVLDHNAMARAADAATAARGDSGDLPLLCTVPVLLEVRWPSDARHVRQRLSHALLIEARDAQQHYWQHPLDLLIARSLTRFEVDMFTQPLAYNMIVIVQVAVCIARDAQVENVM